MLSHAQAPFSPEEYARRLQPLLRRAAGYARSILHSRHDAEDAVQQAALRALQRLDTYDPSRSFDAWWFTLLRNTCVDVLRSRHPNRALPPDRAAPPARDAASAEDWEELALAMDRLQPRDAAILRLKYFAGLSYRDLSECLEIPLGTVMSRLHQARTQLAAQLTRTVPENRS